MDQHIVMCARCDTPVDIRNPVCSCRPDPRDAEIASLRAEIALANDLHVNACQLAARRAAELGASGRGRGERGWSVIRPEGPRSFTLLAHDGGLTLCDAFSGAVFTIRYPEELEQVRNLLATIEIRKPPTTPTHNHGNKS